MILLSCIIQITDIYESIFYVDPTVTDQLNLSWE
jgi:hypothetical protein